MTCFGGSLVGFLDEGYSVYEESSSSDSSDDEDDEVVSLLLEPTVGKHGSFLLLLLMGNCICDHNI